MRSDGCSAIRQPLHHNTNLTHCRPSANTCSDTALSSLKFTLFNTDPSANFIVILPFNMFSRQNPSILEPSSLTNSPRPCSASLCRDSNVMQIETEFWLDTHLPLASFAFAFPVCTAVITILPFSRKNYNKTKNRLQYEGSSPLPCALKVTTCPVHTPSLSSDSFFLGSSAAEAGGE